MQVMAMVSPSEVTEHPHMVASLNVSVPVGYERLVMFFNARKRPVDVEDNTAEAMLVGAVGKSDNPQ